MIELDKIYNEDCLTTINNMSDNFIDLIVTSPPYNKKGFSNTKPSNQIWNKFNINYDVYNDNMPIKEYEKWLISILNALERVLKPGGSIMFNHKPIRHNNQAYLPYEFISKTNLKLYQLIIWNRKNSPNIRKDILVPCTEHVYWLVKDKPKTFRDNLDREYLSEVWNIVASRQKHHPSPFPEQIVKNCILLTTEVGDVVYDPFMGSGTSALVAKKLGRNYIGSETSEEYCNIINKRLI